MSAPFIDLTIPASNGLVRGITTGACAAAAAKGALHFLIFHSEEKQMEIDLPTGEKLRVTLNFCRKTEQGAMAQVTKDAGDDPDVTDKCKVEVEVKLNKSGIHFYAGEGVGTITEEGLQIPKGEPAINPIPRKMIRQNLENILNDSPEPWRESGLDVVVSVLDGEKIALKTFNPRLGIQGGISILGTTGIVEPMSLSAWKASVEIYIDVALATQSNFIVFSPGRWGQNFFHKEKGIPLNRICLVSNFIGFALDHLKQKHQPEKDKVKTIVFAGHPGKLAKVIDGHWDTHSSKSPSALPAILKIADNIFPSATNEKLHLSKTVEHLIQISKKLFISDILFEAVAEKISRAVSGYLENSLEVEVLLADFKGQLIGQAATHE
ncbi:MAG: cobalamin biosynthesis protein CbiD [Nitrospina sp.]|jgi:cobalt-precorrin-5B (C1)-methyltransferase|nr:cobalamin biosynthesis protein CbiD [Nitrospina sp.]MBT5632266.1 cobalamin biosynthesis protein CbiD [Nitrospina sp.]